MLKINWLCHRKTVLFFLKRVASTCIAFALHMSSVCTVLKTYQNILEWLVVLKVGSLTQSQYSLGVTTVETLSRFITEECRTVRVMREKKAKRMFKPGF